MMKIEIKISDMALALMMGAISEAAFSSLTELVIALLS